jgi:hypothetical protein
MRPVAILAAIFVLASAAGIALAQRSDAFQAPRDHPAIAYTKAPVDDPVSKLNRELASGAATLGFEPATGYLRSVLQALNVPIESQVLVFSQTSFQAPKIDESNPRAIYFNDQVSVGWVRGGDVLEVAAQDPRQGTIFYSLPQAAAPKPVLTRDDKCLTCHLSWETRAVPGVFVLTTHPRKTDNEYANGGVVDARDPIVNRWGGWYVTGKQVPARHMGNRAMLRPDAADPEHTPPAPVYESLTGRFDLRAYPSPLSDVVALLVLEHQSHLSNLITRTGWEARLAAFGAAPRAPLAPRVQEAVDEVVDYMLFVDEAPLPTKVVGSSGFAERFAAQGPRDEKGRSLRDLDLSERLMRYPLSYMIYTPAFAGLPAEVKEAAYRRMWRILSGEVTLPRYAHLTVAGRQAIVEILRATMRDLPGYFQLVTR